MQNSDSRRFGTVDAQLLPKASGSWDGFKMSLREALEVYHRLDASSLREDGLLGSSQEGSAGFTATELHLLEAMAAHSRSSAVAGAFTARVFKARRSRDSRS